jgi:hypothetical protein
MSKRVFIIHGWGGHPGEGWFFWLKKKLEKEGIEAYVPEMPNSETPKIEEWVPFIKNLVGEPDEDTYFVGHSMGVQTFLRYIASIDQKVGGALGVAGFFTLIPGSLDAEEKEIAKPWLETPIDTEKVKRNTGAITALCSDNDLFVDLENVKMFEEKLNAKTITFENKGHLSEEHGIMEFEPIFDELMAIIKK